MNKIPLSSQIVTGGLKLLEQSCNIFYLPAEPGYTSKIEIAITLKDQGLQREYSSLRFESMAQMKGFINNIIRAYVFYGRVEGIIDHKNFHYKMCEIKKFVEECFRADPKALKTMKS